MSEQTYTVWRDARMAELLAKKRYNFHDLCDVVTILRGEGGCPWDREQDHHSIRKGLIEECYEVVEAIDNNDPLLLREELGDVLLQIVFHADMEKDAGRFDIEDVANDECAKMIHRHPHVFGSIHAETSDEVLKNWDAIKQEEKQRLSLSDQLRAIPPMLPALMRAQKVEKKAQLHTNESVEDGVNHIIRLLSELQQSSNVDANKALIGDLLLRITALAHQYNVDAEGALSASVERQIKHSEKI